MSDRPTALYDFLPELGRIRDEVVFGEVWESPELSKRDRSMITCAALIAGYRTEELRLHFRRAVDNGVTLEELKAMITHLAFYTGWPCAVNAGRVARELFESES